MSRREGLSNLAGHLSPPNNSIDSRLPVKCITWNTAELQGFSFFFFLDEERRHWLKDRETCSGQSRRRGKRHEEAAWKMMVEETEEKPLMTEDNKNWLLLLCLPSPDDNNTGAGSPSPQRPSAVGTGAAATAAPENRALSGNRLLFSRLKTGSITALLHLPRRGEGAVRAG